MLDGLLGEPLVADAAGHRNDGRVGAQPRRHPGGTHRTHLLQCPRRVACKAVHLHQTRPRALVGRGAARARRGEDGPRVVQDGGSAARLHGGAVLREVRREDVQQDRAHVGRARRLVCADLLKDRPRPRRVVGLCQLTEALQIAALLLLGLHLRRHMLPLQRWRWSRIYARRILCGTRQRPRLRVPVGACRRAVVTLALAANACASNFGLGGRSRSASHRRGGCSALTGSGGALGDMHSDPPRVPLIERLRYQPEPLSVVMGTCAHEGRLRREV